MTKDFRHDWVEASRNRSGVNVHIPRGLLEQIDVDPEEPMQAKRYVPFSGRPRVFINLRNKPDDG